MAIKYRIQYKDIEQVSHVINISADDYTGDITNVQGRAVFEYNLYPSINSVRHHLLFLFL